MATLIVPDVRVHASFLSAMDEFRAEGRAGGRTMVGSDLAEHGDRWHTAEGFAAYLAGSGLRSTRRAGPAS